MHSRLALFFRRPNFLLRYAVAALSVIIAALLYAAIDQWLEGYSPLIVFTVAVMISAWYGGLGPGIFATILGWIVGDYFWIEPLYTLQIVHLHEFVHTAVFVSVGIAISLMSRALERARANAVAANHAKDHFLAVLSHELRNPLAPVMAAVCDLEQNAGLSEPAREDLAVIRRNIDLQTRLIDDLLDVNRLSRDKLPLRFQTCDAHEILRHALEVCQGEAVGKGLAVRFCPAAQRRHLRADPARLQQIFWNLLRNAIKFTSPGGTITVRTADTPSGLHIEVQDTGQGIPIHDLDRIFAPF
jgi:signal transduction histidine kinase